MKEYTKRLKCRKCKGETKNKGFLFSCKESKCGVVFWHQDVLLGDLKNQTVFEKALTNASVARGEELPTEDSKRFYVYVIYLKKNPKKIDFYAGMTGIHPFERYLNHLRGYKASKYPKKWGRYMLKFEGPMTYEEAVIRERSIGNELPGRTHNN